ncbi:hypothetical protein BC938DRAFT_480578 [Jimgerdemannia flammicorona]|uniref:Uncharacterized protein n=1 Tax=Jimgerdemannia flammicorona TaxID=994334 RepID=A0A433QI76_9FUNG|nr:hypothetical protein BC938DRAFT_480578 [Jimgerdemannia flammicorona]
MTCYSLGLGLLVVMFALSLKLPITITITIGGTLAKDPSVTIAKDPPVSPVVIAKDPPATIANDSPVTVVIGGTLAKDGKTWLAGPYDSQNMGIVIDATYTKNGVYQISFGDLFTDEPVVVVSQVTNGDFGALGASTLDNAVVDRVTRKFVTIKTGNGIGFGEPRSFSFIAIGKPIRL